MKKDLIYFQLGNSIVAGIPAGNESDIPAKIRSFEFLPHGWDFGEGSPAPHYVVSVALALHKVGEKWGFEMDAFPGAGGDISIDFYVKDELVQVLINPDLTFELTHESGIGFEYEEIAYFENIQLDKLLTYLVNFHARGYPILWTSSERSIERNTNKKPDDFIQIASKTSTAQSLSLMSSVFKKPAQILVGTLNTFINPLYAENPLRSGLLGITT